MPRFCGNCGAQMADTATACPSCGTAAAAGGTGATAAPRPAPAQAAPQSNEGLFGLLCYSPIALVGIILCLAVDPYKNSKFLRFHAFQALFFALGLFAIAIGLMILGFVFAFLGPLALIMLPIWLIFWVGSMVVAVIMMIKAYQLQWTKLPFIGDLAAKQAGT